MDYDEQETYYSENEGFSEEENVLQQIQPVQDIYEYDQKVINIFNEIKQYVKDENIFICEMLKIDDIYEILEE